MPAKPSGEIKSVIIHQTQKNGDVYVIERKTKYDPEKKYNVTLSSSLIGKIPKGENTMVPTRPKRKNKEKAAASGRSKADMTQIIDYIGKTSGIDLAIYCNTDKDTAQKIISLARYLLGTEGHDSSGITVWQYRHSLPYEDVFSEDTCHDLFRKAGCDKSLIQEFFLTRLEEAEDTPLLAYDTAAISTYSGQLSEAEYDFCETYDVPAIVKFLTLYSADTGQPVAFVKQPGSQSDVTAIESALEQLQALGISEAEIVTDSGYYSEKNLTELIHTHSGFITPADINLEWVKKELDAKSDALNSAGNACPYDPGTYGITVCLMKESAESIKETSQGRIYLHLYFEPELQAAEDSAFAQDLSDLKTLAEKGVSADELSDNALEKINRFFSVSRHDGKITVTSNDKKIAEAKKYHGYYALVSDCEKDASECLYKYRRYETIELFFGSGKQRTADSRTRGWSDEHQTGRMFVQFAALCYYEYFSAELDRIKSSLKKEVTDKEDKNKRNLLSWLENTSVYSVLQWFDVTYNENIPAKLKAKRWSEEIIQRDSLFLQKLGMYET